MECNLIVITLFEDGTKLRKQMTLRNDFDLILICFFFFFSGSDSCKKILVKDISSRTITKATLMGIIRGCFTFFTGTVFGIYLAQSYQVPDVKKEADTALIQAKQVEEKYRKSK